METLLLFYFWKLRHDIIGAAEDHARNYEEAQFPHICGGAGIAAIGKYDDLKHAVHENVRQGDRQNLICQANLFAAGKKTHVSYAQ